MMTHDYPLTVYNEDIDYSDIVYHIRPAYRGNHLVIRTMLEILGWANIQLRFYQEIDNLITQVSPITKATIQVVYINHDMKVTPMPTTLLENINV